MRMIDADFLLSLISDLEVQTGKKCCASAVKTCIEEFFPYVVADCPTIDPEKLPIVQQLRKELKAIKAERDAAVRDMHKNTKCFICMHLPADGNMAHCKHYAACGLNYIHWKWRGVKENNNANQKD